MTAAHMAECRECGTRLAKTDDARREDDSGVYYLCDGCLADRADPSHEVDIFYGAASGQQRAALRRLDPEGVMISHATAKNTPFEGDHDLFIDCGGYHHMMTGDGEYGDADAEYVAYLAEHRPEWFALRDYPCEPDLLEELGRSVEDQQRRTTRRHRSLYPMVRDRGLADRAVAVLQGWTPGQYLHHLDQLAEHGLLTDRVAVGSVCRRGADRDIAEVILAVRDALPSRCGLHAFGVKGSVLRFEEVAAALDSIDSAAYDYQATRFKNESVGDGYNTWRDTARAYLNWRHNLHKAIATETLHGRSAQQTTLDGSAVTNDGGRLAEVAPSSVPRECLCGTTIPPYGDHDDWEPTCRHCHRTALNYWDRELAEVGQS